MNDFLQSTTFLLILLNPFLVIVYLIDIVQKLSVRRFAHVLTVAGLISLSVFATFALVGDAIFARVVHADFSSFQIFGGIIFLLIGINFVFRGPRAIEILRGDSEHVAGAIAMPILIGPGTISASVLAGRRLNSAAAVGSVALATGLSLLIMVGLKVLHDYVRPRNEHMVERYIEIAGRLTALFVGTVSVEMIMQGIRAWLTKM